MQTLAQKVQTKNELSPRIQELEAFFEHYPDHPKEAIIKEDLLRLGIRFSEAALKANEGCQLRSYFLFSFDTVEVDKMERQESIRAPEDIKIKEGPYGLRPTVVSVRLSNFSPYLIDSIDTKLMLLGDGVPIAEVKYFRLPKYYTRSFDDGTPYYDITALVCWGLFAYTTLLRNCQYWGIKEECLFCDMNANVRQQQKAGRKYTVYKEVDKVVEVLETIFLKEKESECHTMVISGGTIVNQVRGLNDEDFYIQYIKAIKRRLGNRWPLMVQTEAKSEEALIKLKEAGADVHLANIEVWDKRLFGIICPGKEKYVGWDEWVRSLVKSVDIFGEGNVSPTIVTGVEMAQSFGFKDVDLAVKSTAEGLDYLMSNGVIPRFNTWCIEPNSPLGGHPFIPLDYYVRIDRCWYETWKKYHLPSVRGCGSMGPGRAVYSPSAFMDVGS